MTFPHTPNLPCLFLALLVTFVLLHSFSSVAMSYTCVDAHVCMILCIYVKNLEPQMTEDIRHMSFYGCYDYLRLRSTT